MTIKELVDRLQEFPLDTEVMVLDGFNGGGYPRTINFGPRQDIITKDMADNAGDCEELVGQTVIVMGYGCY